RAGCIVSSRISYIAIAFPFLRQDSRDRRLFQPFRKALEDAKRRPGGKACCSRSHQHQLGPAKQSAESKGLRNLDASRSAENQAANDANGETNGRFTLSMRQHIGERYG